MPPAQKTTQMMRPREAFTGDHNGVPFVANPSEIFSADHELVRLHPDKFTPVMERTAVTQMTANPGERR
jgi:hypothetical protein